MPEAIKKSDLIQGDPIGDISKDLIEAAKELEKYNKAIRDTTKALSEQSTQSKKTVAGIDAIYKAEKKSKDLTKEAIQAKILEKKLAVENEKVKQAEFRTQVQVNREKERETKARERNAKKLADEGNAYKKLEKETRELKNESKRLGAELLKLEADGKKNTKEFKALEQQYEETTQAAQKGDRQLKKLDKTVGDSFRNVGNYESALDGLSGAYSKITGLAAKFGGVLGLGFGVGELVDSADELDQLNKRLSTSFGLSGDALDTARKDVQALAQIYNKDVNEVMNTANVLTNEFKISQAEAFKLINEGFEKGADVRGEFLTQLDEYATQFVNVGLNAEEAIAVITQQEQKGVFSDKGIDSIKEAGIRLTEMPKSTQEALTAIGMSGEEIQRQITTGQKTVFEVTQEISREIAKLPANSKEVGQVLADVFGGAGEDAKGFVLNLGNVSTNLDELKDTTTEYEKVQAELTKKFIEWKDTAAQGALPVLKFLASNFSEIVKWVMRLTSVFIIYKATTSQTAKNIQDFSKALVKANGNIFKVIKSMTSASKGMEEGGKSAKSMGKALKSIGFAIAIEMAIELAAAFYDVASGARAAREEEEAMAKGHQQAQKQFGITNKLIDDRLKKEQQLIDMQIARGEITQDQANKKMVTAYLSEVGAIENLIAAEKKRVKEAEANRKKLQDATASQSTIQNISFLGSLSPGAAGVTTQLEEINNKINAYTQSISKSKEEVKLLEELQVALWDSVHQLGVEQASLNTENRKGLDLSDNKAAAEKKINTELKFQIDLVAELNELLSEKRTIEQEINDILRDNQITNLNRQIEEQLELQRESAQLSGEINVDSLEALINERARLQKEAIQEETDLEIEELKRKNALRFAEMRKSLENEKKELLAQEGISPEETAIILRQVEQRTREIDALETEQAKVTEDKILEIRLKAQQEQNEIEFDRVDTEKDVNNELIELQLQYAEEQKKIAEDSAKDLDKLAEDAKNERLQTIIEIEEAITEVLSDQIDKRIALLKKEEEAAKNQQDYLENLAAQGNINAQQSIAEQIEIQREAQKEQLRLERQKQNLELISAGLQTFNAELGAGKPVGEAFVSTVTSTSLLVQFLKGLQFYAKGTQNAPEGLAVVDEKGPELITDKKGNIKDLGGKGPRFKYLEKGDRVFTARQTKDILSGAMSVENAQIVKSKQDYAGNSFELIGLKNELVGLRSDVKNIPVSTIWAEPEKTIPQLIKATKSGGSLQFNRYRLKS